MDAEAWREIMSGFVSDMVSMTGEWFDILDTDGILSFIIVLFLILIVASAVWQVTMNAPRNS